MKKKFKLENLCCANCAAKMEADINKLEYVNEAGISFMTQKLMIDAQDDKMDEVVAAAQKIISGYESDCRIVM